MVHHEGGFELSDKGHLIDGFADPLPFTEETIDAAAEKVVEDLARHITLQQEYSLASAELVDGLQVCTWRRDSKHRTGHALAVHKGEAVFFQVDVDLDAESKVVKRSVIELSNLQDASIQESARTLANNHTLEELEILSELVKKQVAQAKKSGLEEKALNLNNDSEVIAVLLLEMDEAKRMEEQVANLPVEAQKSVYENKLALERAARHALREHVGRYQRHLGSVTLALELYEAGAHSVVEIEAYKSKRRDYEVANMRFVYRGDGKPEAISLSETNGAEALHTDYMGEFEKILHWRCTCWRMVNPYPRSVRLIIFGIDQKASFNLTV